MRKLLTSLLFLPLLVFAQKNVQKNDSNVVTNGSIVIGNNTTLSTSGTGSIVATSLIGLPPPAGHVGEFIATDGSVFFYTPGSGSGTVTSVGLSMPPIFTVTNSPVTAIGTLTATLASQSANLVWASPNGSSGSPVFRTLVGADLPSALLANSVTSIGASDLTLATVAGASLVLGHGANGVAALNTTLVSTNTTNDFIARTITPASGNGIFREYIATGSDATDTPIYVRSYNSDTNSHQDLAKAGWLLQIEPNYLGQGELIWAVNSVAATGGIPNLSTRYLMLTGNQDGSGGTAHFPDTVYMDKWASGSVTRSFAFNVAAGTIDFGGSAQISNALTVNGALATNSSFAANTTIKAGTAIGAGTLPITIPSDSQLYVYGNAVAGIARIDASGTNTTQLTLASNGTDKWSIYRGSSNVFTIGRSGIADDLTLDTSGKLSVLQGSIAGGAGNMTITAGTGNSRTLALQTTTSGGTATTFLTGNADQSATLAAALTANGDFTRNGASHEYFNFTSSGANVQQAVLFTQSGHSASHSFEGGSRGNYQEFDVDSVAALRVFSTAGTAVLSTTEATTGAVGSLTTAGGIYAAKAIISGSATASSSTTTGALVVTGGEGIGGALNVGAEISKPTVGTAGNWSMTSQSAAVTGGTNDTFQLGYNWTNAGARKVAGEPQWYMGLETFWPQSAKNTMEYYVRVNNAAGTHTFEPFYSAYSRTDDYIWQTNIRGNTINIQDGSTASNPIATLTTALAAFPGNITSAGTSGVAVVMPGATDDAILSASNASNSWAWRLIGADGTMRLRDNTNSVYPISVTAGSLSAGNVAVNKTAEATTGGAGSLTTAGGIYSAKKIISATDGIFGGTLTSGSGPTTLTDSAGKLLSAALNTVAVGQGGTGLTSGTSGGVPYYSATSTIASSAALASNALVIGGGAGAAPSTTATGSGVLAALGIAANSAGGFVTDTGTATLTNKRLTARTTTITSSATPTVNTDNADCVTITALAAAITSMTTNLTGTPVNFDQLEYRIKDDGTARAITWGASFVSGPATLPTTTTVSKALHVWFEYDTVQSKWVCISTGSDA